MPSVGACPAAQPRHPRPVSTPFLSAPVEQDKALRQLVFRHVTADIKNSNKRGRNERLNRAVQNFMYRCGWGWLSVVVTPGAGRVWRGCAAALRALAFAPSFKKMSLPTAEHAALCGAIRGERRRAVERPPPAPRTCKQLGALPNLAISAAVPSPPALPAASFKTSTRAPPRKGWRC